MYIRGVKYFLLVIMFFSRILHSQEDASLYPVQFSQFYNCYPLVNPASAGTHTDYDAAMGNQKLLGNFSKISTYYLNANMRVINRRGIQNAPFSTVGTLIYNDREGKYLNRSRFYLTYVWHGHVSKNMSVSGGFHLGGMNYSVKGTEISGDGSDIVPDGMIGVQIYNKVFQAGVSYNQIFKSQVQPLEEVATLMPYLNGTISANYKINEDILFRPDFLIRVPTTNEKQKTLDLTLLPNSNLRIINLPESTYQSTKPQKKFFYGPTEIENP